MNQALIQKIFWDAINNSYANLIEKLMSGPLLLAYNLSDYLALEMLHFST